MSHCLEHRPQTEHLANVMIAFCICCRMLSSGYSVATVLNCQRRDYPQEVCTGLDMLSSGPRGEERALEAAHTQYEAPLLPGHGGRWGDGFISDVLPMPQ